MKENAKLLFKHFVLFLIGGILYCGIELLYRQRTHVSMLICGGVCFVLIGAINEFIPWTMKLWKQMLIGSCIVTIVEFITGLIVNVWLGLDVWDYSNVWGNVLGQICLPFSIIWFFISLLAIVADDYLRYWLFGEEKPRYYLR